MSWHKHPFLYLSLYLITVSLFYSRRSQIQIASRTFHFVLPPPPPPDDTPSPSSQSSANRPRSPSVDITSISPPSSQPSRSSPPPPIETKPLFPSPEPQILPPPPPQLPNSNAIGKPKTSAKKRKKGEVDPAPVVEKPKPEDMPPKPPFTYAQLINRAIKAIGGKATLQEICGWIMNTHEYYRYADGAWMVCCHLSLIFYSAEIFNGRVPFVTISHPAGRF